MSRRFTQQLGAGLATLLTVIGVAVASPAHAATVNLDMSCDASTSQSVTITTRDTLRVVSTPTPVCDTVYQLSLIPVPVGNAWMNGTLIPQDGSYNNFPSAPWVLTFASTNPGVTHMLLCGAGEPSCPVLMITVVAYVNNEVAPPPIPGWMQSVGRANADAKCEAGWNPSWQSWAQSVTGGWVCTRIIPSLGK